MQTFLLPSAMIIWQPQGATTQLRQSGGITTSTPEDTEEYRAQARELGYGDDTLAMCRERELLHSLYGELVHRGPSPVLHAKAHPDDPSNVSKEEQDLEEQRVLEMQRWINQNWRGREVSLGDRWIATFRSLVKLTVELVKSWAKREVCITIGLMRPTTDP